MSSPRPITVNLPDQEATHRLSEALAEAARPGLVVLLEGPVGAGKTTLARHVIQSRLALEGLHEDVPSPTFTIVQTYNAGALEIWHADLYRLTATSELEELGLSAAFETAFCLVEWPDRLGKDRPDGLTVTLDFAEAECARRASLTATGQAKALLDALLEDAVP